MSHFEQLCTTKQYSPIVEEADNRLPSQPWWNRIPVSVCIGAMLAMTAPGITQAQTLERGSVHGPAQCSVDTEQFENNLDLYYVTLINLRAVIDAVSGSSSTVDDFIRRDELGNVYFSHDYELDGPNVTCFTFEDFVKYVQYFQLNLLDSITAYNGLLETLNTEAARIARPITDVQNFYEEIGVDARLNSPTIQTIGLNYNPAFSIDNVFVENRRLIRLTSGRPGDFVLFTYDRGQNQFEYNLDPQNGFWAVQQIAIDRIAQTCILHDWLRDQGYTGQISSICEPEQ
jgi:hypothetical protein